MQSCAIYPNIDAIFRLLLITPVTSASVERSNSSLRLVKNAFRSTVGEERLNALLLLFVHKDIPIAYNEIISEFARRDARRMAFLNPLQ